MIYRVDLIDRFQWLAGSKCYDEALDEALVAIALAAHRYEWELIEYSRVDDGGWGCRSVRS